MAVRGLNHAVLYVRDVARTIDFYENALDFRVISSFPGGAFFQAPGSTNDHDLGVFEIGGQAGPSAAGRGTVGLYHLAWEVETLDDLERLAHVLSERKALVGASDHGSTKSLYAKDPDGLEFEVVWLIPAHLLTDHDVAKKATIGPLDLNAEIERFGRSEVSGVGISIPATYSPSPNTPSLEGTTTS